MTFLSKVSNVCNYLAYIRVHVGLYLNGCGRFIFFCQYRELCSHPKFVQYGVEYLFQVNFAKLGASKGGVIMILGGKILICIKTTIEITNWSINQLRKHFRKKFVEIKNVQNLIVDIMVKTRSLYDLNHGDKYDNVPYKVIMHGAIKRTC